MKICLQFLLVMGLVGGLPALKAVSDTQIKLTNNTGVTLTIQQLQRGGGLTYEYSLTDGSSLTLDARRFTLFSDSKSFVETVTKTLNPGSYKVTIDRIKRKHKTPRWVYSFTPLT